MLAVDEQSDFQKPFAVERKRICVCVRVFQIENHDCLRFFALTVRCLRHITAFDNNRRRLKAYLPIIQNTLTIQKCQNSSITTSIIKSC